MYRARRTIRTGIVLAAALLPGLLAIAGAGPAAGGEAPLKVVVTSKAVHSLAAIVMAGIGTPELLVDGSASPHTYAMRPSDAQRVGRADVFVRVSEGLEPFTAKVVQALPSSVTLITLVDAPGLTLLPKRTGGSFETGSHKGHSHGGHSHGGQSQGGQSLGGQSQGKSQRKDAGAFSDPHVWLDTGNAKIMVKALAGDLARRSPRHAVRLEANADAAVLRIDALGAELAAGLEPVRSRPFIVFHDAYQYFERQMGLNAVGAIAVSPESPPSAKRLVELRQKVQTLGAVCVFREPQFEPKLVASVSEGTSARTGVLDPEGASLEPGPELYFALMRKLAGDIRACLGPAV